MRKLRDLPEDHALEQEVCRKNPAEAQIEVQVGPARSFGGPPVPLAGFLVAVDPASSDARYFVGFPPPQSHRDKAVLNAQDWVHMRDGRGVSLASMAAIAGLQRRTFLRRFANATGMAPLEYCRGVRIARARELLISGDTPQKAIARSLGYKDVASFARVFRKATGSAPGAYRKRFGVPPGGFVSKPNSARKWPKLPFGERISAAE